MKSLNIGEIKTLIVRATTLENRLNALTLASHQSVINAMIRDLNARIQNYNDLRNMLTQHTLRDEFFIRRYDFDIEWKILYGYTKRLDKLVSKQKNKEARARWFTEDFTADELRASSACKEAVMVYGLLAVTTAALGMLCLF